MHGDQAERHQTLGEAEHLLSGNSMEMGDVSPQQTRDDKHPSAEERYTDERRNGEASTSRPNVADGEEVAPIIGRQAEYRVYKIRWFGLTQLILLNVVVSWDVSILNIQCLLLSQKLSGSQVQCSGFPSPRSPTPPQTSTPQTPASSIGSPPGSSSPSLLPPQLQSGPFTPAVRASQSSQHPFSSYSEIGFAMPAHALHLPASALPCSDKSSSVLRSLSSSQRPLGIQTYGSRPLAAFPPPRLLPSQTLSAARWDNSSILFWQAKRLIFQTWSSTWL